MATSPDQSVSVPVSRNPAVVFTEGDTEHPTITVEDGDFGTEPPGTEMSETSCGTYTDNGRDYGDQLSFVDTGNFAAGGNGCIGIRLLSWAPTKVRFSFGSAYNSFDHPVRAASRPCASGRAGARSGAPR